MLGSEKKKVRSGSRQDENFSKPFVCVHTHIHVYLHVCRRVFLHVLVCEHLPVYTVASPDGKFPWGEKPRVQSSSSDFTLMMLFVWLKPRRDEEELERENQRPSVED